MLGPFELVQGDFVESAEQVKSLFIKFELDQTFAQLPRDLDFVLKVVECQNI